MEKKTDLTLNNYVQHCTALLSAMLGTMDDQTLMAFCGVNTLEEAADKVGKVMLSIIDNAPTDRFRATYEKPGNITGKPVLPHKVENCEYDPTVEGVSCFDKVKWMTDSEGSHAINSELWKAYLEAWKAEHPGQTRPGRFDFYNAKRKAITAGQLVTGDGKTFFKAERGEIIKPDKPG